MHKSYGLIPVLILITWLSGPGCCQFASHEGELVATLVTDMSGIGDKGFNEIAWRGMIRARNELGVVIKKIESSDPANYVKNLAIAARFGDLTVANGFLMLDAMSTVGKLYPESQFVFIDGIIDSSNVASYVFRSQEIGFLAGILASLMSESHRVGILKGMNIPPVEAFEFGFRTGIKCADATWNLTTDLRTLTAGSFNDPQKGFVITQQFINDNRDIIFQLAGATALGCINAIKNSRTSSFLIGVDLDQDDEIPGKVLTSARKRIDVVVFDAIKNKLNGIFEGGPHFVGIAEGALSLTDMRHTKDIIPEEVRQAIEFGRQLVINKQIRLPLSYDEVKIFQPVPLRKE